MTSELRHCYAHTNGIRMHYVEQGDGPLVQAVEMRRGRMVEGVNDPVDLVMLAR